MQAASDRVSSELVGIMFKCSQCLTRLPNTGRKTWSPIAAARPNDSVKKCAMVEHNKPIRKDLATSLLSYINNQIAAAQRQGVRLNSLTIVTNNLSIRQLRRLSINPKLNTGTRVLSTAIGQWEIRIGGAFKVLLIHSQLRRVANRLKSNLSLTLQNVSKQIIAEGQSDAANGKHLTDLYLLRAYFGAQLWLHEQENEKDTGRKAWYEVVAVSFVEPYIAACHTAREAARLGRRLRVNNEEAEMALVNEVLLQVVSPFAGART